MQIDFDAEKHEYTVDGEKVPSVSDILSPLSAERYAELNPWMLLAAAERGTAVHEATELMDYGYEADEEADPMIEPYLLAYQTFLLEHNVEWEMVEKIVAYSRFEDEKPLFCGTVDRYGKVDGEQAVVDIKTYASMSTDALISASCQTQLYAAAITGGDCEKPVRRYVLHLKKDGDYRLISLDEFDKKRGFVSGTVAWRLYDLHHDLTEARKNRKRGKAK